MTIEIYNSRRKAIIQMLKLWLPKLDLCCHKFPNKDLFYAWVNITEDDEDEFFSLSYAAISALGGADIPGFQARFKQVSYEQGIHAITELELWLNLPTRGEESKANRCHKVELEHLIDMPNTVQFLAAACGLYFHELYTMILFDSCRIPTKGTAANELLSSMTSGVWPLKGDGLCNYNYLNLYTRMEDELEQEIQ